MDGAIAAKIEKGADRAAAALFAGASGFAVFAATGSISGIFLRVGLASAVAAVAYLLCSSLLGRVRGPKAGFQVANFEIAPIPDFVLDELELTDADRLPAAAEDPLELDDILQELGPNSRVVRLFDPAAMPTPAQLKARIDRHLGDSHAPDASQALVDALTELRRSLR